VQTLCGKLKLIGGEDLKIWLDTEQLKQVDSDSLKHHVEQSLALLVFLSEGYLTADFCLTELRTAYNARIPIIVVCDSGFTKGMLEEEIKQFENTKGGEGGLQEEDKATLDAMVQLRQRVFDQWHIEPKGPNNHAVQFSIEQEKNTHPADGGGEILGPVLWWSRSRAFVRVALKGVFQQLLTLDVRSTPKAVPGSPSRPSRRLDDPPQSMRRSDDPPRLLFHDELLDLRKLDRISQPVSLFVSPHYPKDRSDELKRAFDEAGTNLGLKVSISSDANKTADQHSVLLLYPASGLEWEQLGCDIPKSGRQLVNRKLSEALETGGSRTFKEHEWKAFGIKTLHGDSFIQSSGGSFFGPADRGFFRTKELENLLTMRKTEGELKTPVPFLLYSTDMSADMSEHRQEGTRKLGKEAANLVFRPMWSAWPEVSSLQTVAAEEQLRALSRPAEGTPDRASSQTVEHSARELASSFKRRSSRVLPGVLSKVGSQNYVVPPKN